MRCGTIEINFVKSFNYLYQSKMFDNIITYRCRIYCNFSKSNHTYENKSNYQSGVNARFVLMEKMEVCPDTSKLSQRNHDYPLKEVRRKDSSQNIKEDP